MSWFDADGREFFDFRDREDMKRFDAQVDALAAKAAEEPKPAQPPAREPSVRHLPAVD